MIISSLDCRQIDEDIFSEQESIMKFRFFSGLTLTAILFGILTPAVVAAQELPASSSLTEPVPDRLPHRLMRATPFLTTAMFTKYTSPLMTPIMAQQVGTIRYMTATPMMRMILTFRPAFRPMA